MSKSHKWKVRQLVHNQKEFSPIEIKLGTPFTYRIISQKKILMISTSISLFL